MVKGIEEVMKGWEQKTKAKLNSQLGSHAEKKESRAQWRKEETEKSMIIVARQKAMRDAGRKYISPPLYLWILYFNLHSSILL
jgi:hypothetical protein